jgi:hypothetical protein
VNQKAARIAQRLRTNHSRAAVSRVLAQRVARGRDITEAVFATMDELKAAPGAIRPIEDVPDAVSTDCDARAGHPRPGSEAAPVDRRGTHDSGVRGDDHRETSSETSGDAFDDPLPDTDPAPLFDATSKESVGDGERVVSESTRRGTTTLSYRSGPSRVPN